MLYLKKLSLIVVLFLLTTLISATVLVFMGIHINTTGSIPIGIYMETKEPVKKGEYVAFCPENNAIFKMAKDRHYIKSGLCPGGLGLVLKQVVGMDGDVIQIKKDGVLVNGKRLPYSKPLLEDGLQRPLPNNIGRTIKLGKNQLWLFTNQSALSFDSRYFGVIDENQSKSVIKPLQI